MGSSLSRALLVCGVLLAAVLLPGVALAQSSGAWKPMRSMSVVRVNHTATWLTGSGEVLVVGGRTSGESMASAEIFSPQTRRWRSTGSLVTGRQGHVAAQLPGGLVLVAGGQSGSTALASAEIFNPSLGTWSSTGSMVSPRVGAAAIGLDDGRVLVVGGLSQAIFGVGLSSAEVFDPATESWTSVGSTGAQRVAPALARLPGGDILVSGGHDGSTFFSTTSASAQTFDPSSDVWTATQPMNAGRFGHTLTTLPDGRVLAVGGAAGDYGGSPMTTAELFDEATGWTVVGSMALARTGHTASLLPSGDVLIAGGGDINGASATAEIFDAATLGFFGTGNMATPRMTHVAATLLPGGQVLVAGGWVQLNDPGTNTAEIYTP